MNSPQKVFIIREADIYEDVLGVCSTMESAKQRCREYIDSNEYSVAVKEAYNDENGVYQYWTDDDGAFLEIVPWELDLPLPGVKA